MPGRDQRIFYRWPSPILPLPQWRKQPGKEADHAHADAGPARTPGRGKRRPVMSIADAFWMSIGASGRLVDLSRDECLELLAAMSVDRIAYTTDDGPRVLPVN